MTIDTRVLAVLTTWLADKQGTHSLEREAKHLGAQQPREAAAELILMRCCGGGWTLDEIANDPAGAASWAGHLGDWLDDQAAVEQDGEPI